MQRLAGESVLYEPVSTTRGVSKSRLLLQTCIYLLSYCYFASPDCRTDGISQYFVERLSLQFDDILEGVRSLCRSGWTVRPPLSGGWRWRQGNSGCADAAVGGRIRVV
jgi:hypothetical protein